MNNTNLFEEFEERSLETLMGYKDSFLDFTSLENRGIVNMEETTSSRTVLSETIRGINNVSPLATVKFFNQTCGDIFSKYFPDGNNILE